MKVVNVSEDYWKANKTHYVGSIEAPFEKLVALFGEPEFINSDDSMVEWILEIDNRVATIYDMRTCVADGKVIGDPTFCEVWHVGAFDKCLYADVIELLKGGVQ